MSRASSLVTVCMARNNGDIIQSSMEHLLALFDHVIVIDHRSTDGTKQYLQALAETYPEQVVLYHFLDEGFYQSELMTWTVRNLEQCRSADWLFILDTDEFLPFPDKSAFRDALSQFADTPVIRMPWNNLAPAIYDDSSLHERAYIAASEHSGFCKVAFRPAQLDMDDLVVLQGNHALQLSGSGKKLKGKPAFPLLHIPISSREQYALKTLLIHLADISKGADSEESFRNHRYKRIEPVMQSGLSDALLNASALHYGEKSFSAEGYDRLDESSRHERLDRLGVARKRLEDVNVVFDDISTSIVKLVAQHLRHDQPGFMADGAWVFELKGNNLSIAPVESKDRPQPAGEKNRLRRLRKLLGKDS